MKTRYAGGLSYLLVVICLLLLRVSMYTGIVSGVSDTDLYFTLVCQLLCFGVAPACLWILLSRGNELAAIGTLPAYFNIKKCSLSNWLLTLAIAVPAVVITYSVSTVWSQGLYIIGYNFPESDEVTLTVSALLADIALTAVLPALFEEFTHRGLVFAGYRDAGEGVVFVSALLFALMHQNVRQVGYTFVLGVVLAMVVFYSGSLFPAVFLHFFNNLISVFMTYSDMNPVFGFMEKARVWLWTDSLGRGISAALFVASVLACVFALNAMRRKRVRAGELAPRFPSPAAAEALPLYKDVPFLVVVALGVTVTAFSLVWGLG